MLIVFRKSITSMSSHVIHQFTSVRKSRTTNVTGTRFFSMSDTNVDPYSFSGCEQFSASLTWNRLFGFRMSTVVIGFRTIVGNMIRSNVGMIIHRL